MRLFLALLFCLALAVAHKPLTSEEVPAGWAEPEYSNSLTENVPLQPLPTLVELRSTKDSVAEKKAATTVSKSQSQQQAKSQTTQQQVSGSSAGSGGEVQMNINGQRVSMYPAAVIPGPWFGSFSTRMDGMGYSVPPYAFDPNNYARLGPYRALTNKYSDGTSYPLNMQKYDNFPYSYGGAWAGPTTGEYVAPLSLVQEGEDFRTYDDTEMGDEYEPDDY